MDGNKDAALKCFDIGKLALNSGDRPRALKFLSKARRLDPALSGVDDLLSDIQNESCNQSDSSASSGVTTDEVSSSSSKPSGGQSNVRHRRTSDHNGAAAAASSSSSPSVAAAAAYTEEQMLIVRQIRRKKDYYEILGVDKTCTVEDVRKAYRKLSLKVHPDKNKAPGAEEAFKAVSKAFQCLSNEENKSKYDVSGSDEPVVYQRRRSQGFNNGFFDGGDVDADEIFRNFFGGMAAANSTQFRGFTFGTGMGPNMGGGVHHSGEFSFRTLIQLLPVLVILLVSFLPSSDPVYALYKSYPYEHKLSTQKSVPYYVKSAQFEQDYPFSSPDRVALERRIEAEYFSILRQNCRQEMQRRQWGFAQELTHCDMLKRFENKA